MKQASLRGAAIALYGCLGLAAGVPGAGDSAERIKVRAADARTEDSSFPASRNAGQKSQAQAGPDSSEQMVSSAWRVLWKRAFPRETTWELAQAERATPLISGEQVYVGGSRFKGILQLARRSGEVERRLSAHGGLEASPTLELESGDIISGDNGGYVQRIRSDGTVLWEHEALGPILSRPAVGQGLTVFQDIDGTLVALDLKTGAQVWVYRRPPRIGEDLTIFGAASPLILGDRVVAGFADGHAAALKLSDGSLLWEQSILAEGRWLDVDGAITQLGENTILMSAYRGATVCLKIDTGELTWRAPFGSSTGVLVGEDKVFLPDTDGSLVALSTRSGEQLWKWETPSKTQPLKPSLWRNQLLVPLASGAIHFLNPTNGTPKGRLEIEEDIAGFAAPVVVSDDVVYAATNGGFVYALGWNYGPHPMIQSHSKEWTLVDF